MKQYKNVKIINLDDKSHTNWNATKILTGDPEMEERVIEEIDKQYSNYLNSFSKSNE